MRHNFYLHPPTPAKDSRKNRGKCCLKEWNKKCSKMFVFINFERNGTSSVCGPNSEGRIKETRGPKNYHSTKNAKKRNTKINKWCCFEPNI